MNRRIILVSAVAVIMGLLPGCAARGIADDVTADKLTGTWEWSQGGSEMSLTLAKDHAFNAAGWPVDLMCNTPGAESIGDLEWHRAARFEGTWEALDETRGYSLTFFVDGDLCGEANWTANVWQSDNGIIELKVFLPSVMDADSANQDQVLWLEKLP